MSDVPAPGTGPDDPRGERRVYAGGEVESYTGRVNRWLLVVYALLAAWGIYYLVAYWNGGE